MISRTAILSLIVIASTSAAPDANYYARMDAQTAPSESVDKETYNLAANVASDTIAEIDYYPQDTIDAGYSGVSEDDSLPVAAAESGVPTDITNDIYQDFPREPIEAGDSGVPTEADDFSENNLPPLETYDAGDLDMPTDITNDIYQDFPIEPIEAGDSGVPTETDDFSENNLPPLETYDAGDLDIPTETENSRLNEILSAGTYEATESDVPYQEDYKISAGFVCSDPITSLFTILMSIVMI